MYIVCPRPKSVRRAICFLAALAIVLSAGSVCTAAPPVPPEVESALNHYESPYYMIHTDLSIEQSREAYARITAMAEEYHARTRDFAGQINRKLPFYLLSDKKLYEAAGGLPNSGGVFMGNRLMANADKERGAAVWSTVQHEGFHQFAHFVIRGNLPTWINEGLAEYFEKSIWTGDGFVTGNIPQNRLEAVRRFLADGTVMRFDKMMAMSQREWNSTLADSADSAQVNYNQVWSMTHFLIHADEGRYREAFAAHIKDISKGQPWKESFAKRFGQDTMAFERRYAQWWSQQGDWPTSDLYFKSIVQTLTSFLVRAHMMGMRPRNIGQFFEACEAGIQVDPTRFPRLWLPQSLLTKNLEAAKKYGNWKLVTRNKSLPKLIMTSSSDGTKFTGSFRLNGRDRPSVTVAVKKLGMNIR